MMTPKPDSIRMLGCIAASVVFSAGTAMGAGFALHEHSISGMGVGFASGASGGQDNSSMFFNPATLSLTPDQQITAGFHIIAPVAEFKNRGSLSGYVPGVSPGVPTQGGNATSDDPALVPNLYYSNRLSEDWVLGMSVTSPYGLATSYTNGWVGRYIALETSLETVNLNLALSYDVSDKVSIGFGISGMHGDALLTNAIDFGLGYLNALQAGVIPANAQTLALAQDVRNNLGGSKYDGKSELTGDDIGYGFNLGILITPNENTRIGIHYRSKVTLDIDGRAKFDTGLLEPFFGSLFVDQGGSVTIDLPDSAQVSITHQLTPEWAIMADIYHTWWSKFQELNIAFSTGYPENSIIPEKWEDVFRYSVGTTYEASDKLQLRAGLVLDESPVTSNLYRSPRIPDQDRLWVTLGLGYQVNESWKVDVGYVHIFVDDPVIDNPTHTRGAWLKGKIDATTNILSFSCSYSF